MIFFMWNFNVYILNLHLNNAAIFYERNRNIFIVTFSKDLFILYYIQRKKTSSLHSEEKEKEENHLCIKFMCEEDMNHVQWDLKVFFYLDLQQQFLTECIARVNNINLWHPFIFFYHLKIYFNKYTFQMYLQKFSKTNCKKRKVCILWKKENICII